MAYGQTGSGKTYTMGSEAHYGGLSDRSAANGLIPRFMNDIFAQLEYQRQHQLKAQNEADSDNATCQLIDFKLSASFLEVYGEDVHDLLDEQRKSLPIREDSNGEIMVVGLTKSPVVNAEDALRVLHEGTLHRTTAATLMNHTSSRSHAVFTVYLQKLEKGAGDVEVTTASRLTFVDLAGSERMKKTGAEGERAREGIKINEGLLALGNVINALADDDRLAKGEKVHVPYRQSKLTRLLQDALGGNSQTLFLACVSPSDTNASETLSTLQYANRARNIKNAPTKNVDPTLLEIQRLNALTEVMQLELVKQRFCNMQDASEDALGNTDAEATKQLFQRKDVQEYLQSVYKMADAKRGQTPAVNMTLSSTQPQFTSSGKWSTPSTAPSSSMSSQFASSPKNVQETPIVTPSRKNQQHNSQTIANETNDSLLDVNPDEDIAILDQLLELQQRDQEYNNLQKRDEEELKQVEGELEQQEGLLLQLKNSLVVYHQIKEKYEILMGEVQSLEVEKASLAEELQRVQVDPTKGCSKAIKMKLDRVEASLARARSETRKHQQMYRKAEQQAQKCRMLENKINDLKHGKVMLVRKQRDAAQKHRDFTEAKTREINALKKKERKTGKQVTKLEAQCRKHKANLDRRKDYCDKLTSKLKETESHLMRLLTMRKRDLQARTKKRVNKSTNTLRLPKDRQGNGADTATDVNASYAAKTEETSSIKFLLEKLVSDRVQQAQMKRQYEEGVDEYSKSMRSLVEEMKVLKQLRESSERGGMTDADKTDLIQEHEQNVEELELKLELVAADLENIRARLPDVELLSESDADEGSDDCADKKMSSKSEEAALKMISGLNAPMTRTLLLELLDILTNSEFERKSKEDLIKRKESALQSFQSEVENLNSQIETLSNNYEKRLSFERVLSAQCNSDETYDAAKAMEHEIHELKSQLEKVTLERENTLQQVTNLTATLNLSEQERATITEKYILNQVATADCKANEEASKILKELQDVWANIGVSVNERENVRGQIETCLEDTCNAKLKAAEQMRLKVEKDVNEMTQHLRNMFLALGYFDRLSEIDKSNFSGVTMLEHLNALQGIEKKLLPTFNAASERRERIVKDVQSVLKALDQSDNLLSQDLVNLVHNKVGFLKRKKNHYAVERPDTCSSARKKRAKMFKDVEDMVKALEPLEESIKLNDDIMEHEIILDTKAEDEDIRIEDISNFLSASFLDNCERDAKRLRMLKSEILAANGETRNKAQVLVEEMHLSSKEVLSLSIQTVKRIAKEFPVWWDPRVAEEVCNSIKKSQSILGVNKVFTNHLEHVHDSLEKIAGVRRIFAEKLKLVVERALEALLSTVEDEVESKDAYASFHQALFRLPQLSKERIQACIHEINVLVNEVEVMSQSEIEALTVVWEALDVTSSEREQFWSELEELKTIIEKRNESPFDAVLQAFPSTLEKWLQSAVKDATKAHKMLHVRLMKMEKIHGKVETLRAKQDIKSKIMSLDSEIRLISAHLAEFEERASNKQRLLTKKMNSSTLLQEERFRKQMQAKFATKLGALGELLQEWEKIERVKFDASLLSDDVRMLLGKSDNLLSWVEERTAFMHLKTSMTKGKRKPGEDTSPIPPPPRSVSSLERVSPKSPNTMRKKSPVHERHASPAHSREKRKSLRHQHAESKGVNNTTTAALNRKTFGRKTPSRRSSSQTRKLSTASSGRISTPSSNRSASPRRQSAKPIKKDVPRRRAASSTTDSSLSALPKPPILDVSINTNAEQREMKSSNSSTLLPFGNVLSTTPSKAKENMLPFNS